MPYTTADVEKHTKLATTAKLKRQWVAIANSALDECMEDGGDDESCAPGAIRRANSVIKKGVWRMEETTRAARRGLSDGPTA